MNVRLFVLGLLARHPMHGYQIRKTLEQSRTSAWAEVLPGSIYHALAKMEREGLVEPRPGEPAGERNRTVYRITRSGRAELRRLAEEAWGGAPNPYPTRLYSALAFMDVLPGELRRAKLAAARARIEGEIADWGRAIESKSPEMPAAARLALENARAHLELDRKLLCDLEALEEGALLSSD